MDLFFLITTVPPRIDQKASTESEPQVIVNESIILSCVVTGTPKPEVKWLKNGQPIDTRIQRYRLLAENRQLQITRAQVTPDTARYTCIAMSEAGVADRDFDLDVLGKYQNSDKEFYIFYE